MNSLLYLLFLCYVCIGLCVAILKGVMCCFVKHSVPTASVSVTGLVDNVIVNGLLSMECNITIAKSIIGRVDIIWTVNGTIKRRINYSVGDIYSEYVLYRDVYNKEALLSDDNTEYYCEAVVNTSILLKGNDSITIMLKYGKYSAF